MSVVVSRLLVTALPLWVCLFPDSLCGISADTGPRFLASPGSSSRELLLLYRVQTCFEPACRLHRSGPRQNAFHGVSRLLSDMSMTSPLGGRLPSLPTFRPQRFSRSRRLTPGHTSWAYFIPLPLPRFALQGVSPVLSRSQLLAGPCSLDLLCRSPRRCASAMTPGPGIGPSERYSEHRSVATNSGVTHCLPPIPS
jgi:hypothetical protein